MTAKQIIVVGSAPSAFDETVVIRIKRNATKPQVADLLAAIAGQLDKGDKLWIAAGAEKEPLELTDGLHVLGTFTREHKRD